MLAALKLLDFIIVTFESKVDEHEEKQTQIITEVISNNIHNKYMFDHSTKCDFQTCSALQNIGCIIKYYQTWCSLQATKQTESDMIDDQYEMYQYINTIMNNGEYSTVDLINNYHHLLFFHDNKFEDIYGHFISVDILNAKCIKSECDLLCRNHRDRLQCSLSHQQCIQMYYGITSIQEINILQLLDELHCYYLHSFDRGYRLTMNQRKIIDEVKCNDNYDVECNDIDNKLLKAKEIILAKSKNNKSELNKSKYTQHDTMFSFGILFVYPEWKTTYSQIKEEFVQKETSYANVQEYTVALPIDYKYKSFKEELLSNNECTMTVNALNGVIEKANDYLKCNHCAAYQPSEIDEEPEWPGIMETCITAPHLMSVRIYCEYDVLSAKFSGTYRKKSDDESYESVIERHQEFAHFGRLLKEVCHYFNDTIEGNYYHGIIEEVYFDHTIVEFQCPFSTSKDLAVAINFCANTGYVLTLETDQVRDSGFGFMCAWISPYVNEQETLCFGWAELKISSIVSSVGHNYSKYLIGLHIIERLMNGDEYFAVETDNESIRFAKQMTFRLLQHEPNKYHALQNIPKYVESLLHYHCTMRRTVAIDWASLNKTDIEYVTDINLKYMDLIAKGFQFILKLVCLPNLKFVNLALLVMLFPNMSFFTLHLASALENPIHSDPDAHEYKSEISKTYKLEILMTENVISFLKSNHSSSLNQIEFYCIKERDSLLISEIISKHQNVFESLHWKMYTQSKDDDDTIRSGDLVLGIEKQE